MFQKRFAKDGFILRVRHAGLSIPVLLGVVKKNLMSPLTLKYGGGRSTIGWKFTVLMYQTQEITQRITRRRIAYWQRENWYAIFRQSKNRATSVQSLANMKPCITWAAV